MKCHYTCIQIVVIVPIVVSADKKQAFVKFGVIWFKLALYLYF